MEEAKSNRIPTSTVLIFLFIAIGLLLRWMQLDLRPLHHDESIHVMFGRYFFDWPNDNYYKYNPEYHGPLLYNVLRFIYETFSDTEVSARGMVAFFGSVLMFLPWLLRKYLDQLVVVGLTAAIALSPTMIYWSRFVREDIFVLAGMAMMLWGVLGAKSELKSFWVLLGVVFQYTSKENSYVTIALFWVFFVADWVVRRVFDNRKEPLPLSFIAPIPFALVILLHLGMTKVDTAYQVTEYGRIWMDAAAALGFIFLFVDCVRNSWKTEVNEDGSFVGILFKHIATYRYQFFASFFIAGFLFSYLFSAGFRYRVGIIDGLYFKGITYWIEKHEIERIKGPFLFHFYQLAWYEFAFIIAVVAHGIHFFQRHCKNLSKIAIGVIMFAILAGLFNAPDAGQIFNPSFFLWKKIKAKDYFDIIGGIILLAYPVLVTYGHWRKKEWNMAFWGYLFTATFFTYSYLGEKVPWLSSYPLLAGWIYFAAYVSDYRRRGEMVWMDQKIDLSLVLYWFGWIGLGLSGLFIIEEMLRFSVVYPGEQFYFKGALIRKLLQPNQLLLIISVSLIVAHWIDKRFKWLGSYHGGTVLLVLFSIFTARIAYVSNYEFKYHELGYISQVHTTHEAKDFAVRVRKEILENITPTRPTILVEGDATWPYTWYLRDLPTYKFNATPDQRRNFTYIVQDERTSTIDGYDRTTMKLRGWWVPDFTQMTLRRFLNVSLNQRVWGGFGYQEVAVLTKSQ